MSQLLGMELNDFKSLGVPVACCCMLLLLALLLPCLLVTVCLSLFGDVARCLLLFVIMQLIVFVIIVGVVANCCARQLFVVVCYQWQLRVIVSVVM